MATRVPPLNPTPTRSEKEVRKTRIQRAALCAWRGCSLKPWHNGPHFIPVSTASIARAKARGVRIVTCPRCGFYGSGAHTTPDKVRCVAAGGRNARW